MGGVEGAGDAHRCGDRAARVPSGARCAHIYRRTDKINYGIVWSCVALTSHISSRRRRRRIYSELVVHSEPAPIFKPNYATQKFSKKHSESANILFSIVSPIPPPPQDCTPPLSAATSSISTSLYLDPPHLHSASPISCALLAPGNRAMSVTSNQSVGWPRHLARRRAVTSS